MARFKVGFLLGEPMFLIYCAQRLSFVFWWQVSETHLMAFRIIREFQANPLLMIACDHPNGCDGSGR